MGKSRQSTLFGCLIASAVIVGRDGKNKPRVFILAKSMYRNQSSKLLPLEWQMHYFKRTKAIDE